MNQLHSPDYLNSVPPGVEVFWSNKDQDDPERCITGANFHTAELRLNQGVDLSPELPLTKIEARQIFLMSLGMTDQEQVTYLNSSPFSVREGIDRAQDKLRVKGQRAIGRLFTTGVVEVVKPFMLAEEPSYETYKLVNDLCSYDTLRVLRKAEGNYNKRLLRRTAAHYGLRGLYDFMTWAYAARLLDSSPPTFVDPAEDEPKFIIPTEDQSKPRPFVWHRTADGFEVNVFDEAQSCARLEFEGEDRRTAWLRAIVAEGGRIAVRNFFDTPNSRVYLSQVELGALAITTLGGIRDDMKRLGIHNPKAVLLGVHEKLGVPVIPPPYAPIRAATRSFEQEVMACEVPPKIMTMADKERARVRSLAHFDSHAHAAEELGLTLGSLRTVLSRLTTDSPFPALAGIYLMMRAADAHANPEAS